MGGVGSHGEGRAILSIAAAAFTNAGGFGGNGGCAENDMLGNTVMK